MTWFDSLSNWLAVFFLIDLSQKKGFRWLAIHIFYETLFLSKIAFQNHVTVWEQFSWAWQKKESAPTSTILCLETRRCRASGKRIRGTMRKRRKNLQRLQSLGKKTVTKKSQTRSKKVKKSNICTKCSFADVDHAHIPCTH